MPRPRILSSSNHKRRDVDERGEKDVGTERKVNTEKAKSIESDCEIIRIDDGEVGRVAKKQPRGTTIASATKKVRRDHTIELEESDKLTSRMPLETKEAVTAVRQNSSLSLRLVTKGNRDAVRSVPRATGVMAPARVYQSKPAPSARLAHKTGNPLVKVNKLASDSSRLATPAVKSSAGATQLASNALAAAQQSTPQNSSLRALRPSPNVASRVSQVVVTSPGAAMRGLAKSGATTASSVATAGAAATRPVSVAQLVAASPTDVLRLVPSSSPHVMHLLADRTLEIGRVLSRSTKRIPQLVKMELTGPAPSTRDSIQSTRSQTSVRSPPMLDNSTIQLPALMSTGLDNPNIVMVLPSPVVGVQRQRGGPPNNSSRNGKRTSETKRSSEQREKHPRQKSPAGNNADGNPRRITDIRHGPWSEEKSQGVKIFAETPKTLIPVSREPTRESPGIATRSLSAAKSAALETSDRANPVETKKAPSSSDTSRGSVNLDSPCRKRLGSSGDAASSVNVARTNNPVASTGGRRNVRLAAKANPKKPKLSNLGKTHARLTKILVNQPIHTPKNTWRARCIVCKERFTDKYEFHRHATLSHPGIRIVFCELCSASFRFDDELRRHRISYHKIIVPKDTECTFAKIERSRATIPTTASIKTENRAGRPRSRIPGADERRPTSRKRLTIENSANAVTAPETSHSNDDLRARSARKKITVSCVRTRNWKKLSPSTGLVGPRRRQPQTNKTQESTSNNVEVRMIKHDAVATKNKFKSAEIKKLIVPITRLEGVALEKYMFKLAKNPVVDFTSTLSKHDSSSNDPKPAGSSNAPGTSLASSTSGANGKLAKQQAVSEPGKIRRTRGSRTRARPVRNLTITRKTTKLELPAAPRRSARRREAKEPSTTSADGTSNLDVAVARSLDHAEASTATGSSETLVETTVNSVFPSYQDITPIKIGDSPQVADIAKEQQIIRKLVSRSSVSSCATLDSNRPKEDSNSEKRLVLDDPDSESSHSTMRRAAIYTSSDETPSSVPVKVKKLASTSNRSMSKLSSSSDDARTRKFVESGKSKNLSPALSSSSGERFFRAESSTSINSDESLFARRLRSESARCSLKSNEFDKASSKRNDNMEKRIGKPKEKSKENCRNSQEDDDDKNRGESKNVSEADQPDEERADEKSEGNDEQSKDNVNGGDDRGQEKADDDGKQTEDKSSGVEKQSGDKSNRVEEKESDEVDDGDENSKNVDNQDKERDDGTDDDEECKEKTSHVDEEAKSTDEDDHSTKKSKVCSEKQPREEAISVCRPSQEKPRENDSEQSKDSNNADDTTSSNAHSNIEGKNRETVDYPGKASTSGATSNTRKTYLCSKRLSKNAKEQHEQVEDQTEAPHDLCSVCKQLFILMKKVSSQLGERKTEAPIKCPLCQRYFISMYHLKLHVATNHLQCPNEVTCGKAKLSSVEETLRLTELDCETVFDTVVIECPRCATKFDLERDLNDHLIAQHEAILPKDAASNECPEYLRDLRIGCFETIIRESTGLNSSQTERESSTLDCSLCDGKFVKTAEYVRHLREAHRTTESALRSDRRNNSRKSFNDPDPRFSLYGSQPEVSSPRDDGDAGEVHESLRNYSNDQMTADREYVLKQLLSDNSSGDEKDETRSSPRPTGKTAKRKFPALRRDTIVEKSNDKTVVGYISSFHTCNVCEKKFRRAHDLLIHGFYHADNDTSKTAGDNVEHHRETSQNPQEPCADASSKKRGNGDDLEKAVRREDSDNVSVLYGANGASQKCMLGSKRRAPSLSLNASSSKSDTKVVASKKRKVSNAERPRDASSPTSGGQSRDADKASDELLDPAVDLTKGTDPKLPIACGKCNRHFPNRWLLNEHLFFLHDDSLKDTVLEDILASKTGAGSRGSRVRGEKSSASWRCDTCVQDFKLLQGYRRHRYFVHGDDSMVHVCENCSKVLTSVTTVNVHICTDVASYNCRTCNESFSTGMSLRLHNTEKHTETRGPHVCLQCNKSFLTNAMLESHLKCNHRFVRPYKARRSSPVRMATHETTNDGEEKVSSEPDEAGHEEARDRDNCEGHADKEVNSKAADEPVESRRGRWRACRGKKITSEQSPLAPKRAPAYRPPGKRKRGRPRKYPRSDDEESSYRDSQDEDQEDEATELIVSKQSTLYVDVTEIHQCSLCQLYCVSKSTLRNHMNRIHSANDEICQLCQKAYTHGKLMRHVIDNHVTSEDGSVPELEEPWTVGTNSNETDTEILVKMLGIDRLVSLCEYRRYAEKINLDAYPCLSCKATFRSHELYRYHFLLQHDSICALCNIEFKTGHDAARHKNDVHGSVGRYIWFADRTVLAMTSTKNFAELTDRIFIDRLTRGEVLPDQDTNATIDEDDDAENLDYTKIFVYGKPDSGNIANEPFTMHDDHGINLTEEVVETQEIADDRERIGETSNSDGQTVDHTISLGEVGRRTSVDNVRANASNVAETPTITRNKRRQADASNSAINDGTRIASVEEPHGENVSVASYDFSDPDDVKLIIVVTDEDLERFNIVTRHPNIWGLAAEISSTYEDITPNEVKRMLECHFERQEDFDA